MKILVAGDFCDNGRVSDIISQGKYGYLFDDITSVLSRNDYNIVNFEFPIVSHKGYPIRKNGPSLKGQIKSIEAIKYAGFNVCTLANNHILDQGEDCCMETKQLLESSGIKTIGVGENLSKASEILYLEKNNEVAAIINCCEHEFSVATENSVGANPLNSIKQYYRILEAREKADYVIVIVHGGHEHFQLPSPRMKELYRFFVDVGADAVVNHHQHCFSGYEVYKEKPIFYGLGNLLFDWAGRRDSLWNEGYMVELDFNPQKGVAFNIVPYKQCNEAATVKLVPETFQLDTLRKIEELNEIVSDDTKLTRQVNEFYKKGVKTKLMQLEPYRNKVMMKLHAMGFIPSIFDNNRIAFLLNNVECESHRDVLSYILNLKFKR